MRCLNKIICFVLLAILVSGNATQILHAKQKKIMYVSVDEAKLLRINKSANSIIIGNSDIVEVNVFDERTLLLTGISNGLTNIIVLDAKGNEIISTDVSVGQKSVGTITIYNADQKQDVRCLPRCELPK